MNPNPELPEHIILNEILPRIPATSLVKFKSVCRQWKTFISSAEFVKTHFDHPSYLSSTRSILTLGFDDERRLTLFEAVDYYHADSNNNNNLDLTNFGAHFKALFQYLSGSCNGLAFLIASPKREKYEFSNDDDYDDSYEFSYVVYNPVLGVGDYVEIPHPRRFPLGDGVRGYFGRIYSRYYSFGFGYDSKSDDYYIVAIDLPGNFKIVVYVYSLRSHQWEDYIGTLVVKHNDYDLPLIFECMWYCHIGTLVKETLHWGMSQGHDNKFILAYALATRNQAKKMHLPRPRFGNARQGGGATDFNLCCLDECLCAWANYEGSVADMWMMKEYGVWESWTNLFCIQLDHPVHCRNFFGFTSSGMVLLFTNLDEFYLVDFTYDPPNIFGPVLENEKRSAVNYSPSLISVLAIISGPG